MEVNRWTKKRNYRGKLLGNLWSYRYQKDVILHFRLRRVTLLSLYRLEVHDQRFLHREHRVVIEVFALSVKNLGRNWFVTFCESL